MYCRAKDCAFRAAQFLGTLDTGRTESSLMAVMGVSECSRESPAAAICADRCGTNRPQRIHIAIKCLRMRSNTDLTDVRHLIVPISSQSSPDMRAAKFQRSTSTYLSQAVMTANGAHATAVLETCSRGQAMNRTSEIGRAHV